MSPGEIEDYAEALRILPSKSTLSRVALSLDAAYSLHCRKIWQEHFARGQEAACNMLADSSPQFQRNWLLVEVFMFKNAPEVTAAARSLFLDLPDFHTDDHDAWKQWARELPLEQRQGMADRLRIMRSQVWRHCLIPTALGSARVSLPYKLHALLHAAFVDAGSWPQVEKVFQSITSFTTDQGTERLFVDVKAAISDLQNWDYLPNLGGGSEPGVPCGGDGGSNRPNPNPGNNGDSDIIMGLLGGGSSRQEARFKRARMRRREGECGHPGCEEQLWAVCEICYVELCHLHFPGAGIRFPSRCHEHCPELPHLCPCPDCRMRALPPPGPAPGRPSGPSQGGSGGPPPLPPPGGPPQGGSSGPPPQPPPAGPCAPPPSGPPKGGSGGLPPLPLPAGPPGGPPQGGSGGLPLPEPAPQPHAHRAHSADLLGSTLWMPGLLHIFHNAVGSVSVAMPAFATWVKGLNTIVNFFKYEALRDRFCEACLEGSHKSFRNLFEFFKHRYIDWRWGSLISCCAGLTLLQWPLKLHWDPAKMKKKNKKTTMQSKRAVEIDPTMMRPTMRMRLARLFTMITGGPSAT